MDEREKRRQKILLELAERFNHSSEIMRQVARRIGEAAEANSANRRRLEKSAAALRRSVGVRNESLPFSYREFVEFSSAGEFERFRNLAPIGDDDIGNVDWDALARGLLG